MRWTDIMRHFSTSHRVALWVAPVLLILAVFLAPAVVWGAEHAATVEHPVRAEDAVTAEHGVTVGHGEAGPAAEGAHGEAAHGEEGAEAKAGPPELPHIFLLLQKLPFVPENVKHFLHAHFHNGWENIFFTYLVVFLTWIVLAFGMKRKLRQPGKFQGGIESVVHGLYNFFSDVMGKENARTFVPLVGSLFLFIFLNNIIGIVPLMKSSSAGAAYYQGKPIPMTFALSLTVFVVVQVVGFARCGVWGRIHHLMGSPQDTVGWVFAPLLFVLEVIGELVKPVSLALRLFGNIFGEDILLGAFALMGVLLMGVIGWKDPFIGLPLQFPFLFLALLTSVIQALVFSLLSSIYILLALSHHEHHEEEGHGASQH